MKKLLITLLFLSISTGNAFGLDIVYPKSNPAKINSSSTFFIGSTKPEERLKINDVDVPLSPKGAFAQIVPLNVGTNDFIITSGEESVKFSIERAQPSAAPQISAIIEYPETIFVLTKSDNVALRATPVDGGINRLAHLSKDVQLQINGEKGKFYRVYLNSKQIGWVLKTDVEPIKGEISSIILNKFRCEDKRHYLTYEFELNKKAPFSLKEENGLKLSLFNVKGQLDETYLLQVPVEKLIGYDIFYDENKLVLKIRKQPKLKCDCPLDNITITVDAGHGGSEKGAIACGGEKEKDINLAIAKNLKLELENKGAKVFMTRDEDVQISLPDRVKFAKDKDSTILVSIHANALPDGQDPILNRGTSVYYYHNQAKALADSILNEITTQVGTQNDKVRQGSLALVRPTSSVSVLVEVGYVINPCDYELLIDADFQKKCAKAIADGIEKYLRN